MKAAHQLARVSLAIIAPLFLVVAASSGFAQSALSQLRAKVNHIIVIYQENWSFDSLYGHFPGATGPPRLGGIPCTGRQG